MFTTFAASFAFGYCVTDLFLKIFTNNKFGKYDEPRSTHESSTHGT